jgi:hypothetical protein
MPAEPNRRLPPPPSSAPAPPAGSTGVNGLAVPCTNPTPSTPCVWRFAGVKLCPGHYRSYVQGRCGTTAVWWVRRSNVASTRVLCRPPCQGVQQSRRVLKCSSAACKAPIRACRGPAPAMIFPARQHANEHGMHAQCLELCAGVIYCLNTPILLRLIYTAPERKQAAWWACWRLFPVGKSWPQCMLVRCWPPPEQFFICIRLYLP